MSVLAIRIERVYYDGTGREVMLSFRSVLVSFDVYNGSIFYSIRSADCVIQYDVLRGENSTFVAGVAPLSYLSVYFERSSYTERFVSPCLYSNCSHLCVVTNNNKSVCLCSNGYERSQLKHSVRRYLQRLVLCFTTTACVIVYTSRMVAVITVSQYP